MEENQGYLVYNINKIEILLKRFTAKSNSQTRTGNKDAKEVKIEKEFEKQQREIVDDKFDFSSYKYDIKWSKKIRLSQSIRLTLKLSANYLVFLHLRDQYSYSVPQ
jgi:hypothetical protein